MSQKKYDSTIARIAGNLLSGQVLPKVSKDERDNRVVFDAERRALAARAVALARAIVEEVKRTEPEPEHTP